jgi:hypothetical protein
MLLTKVSTRTWKFVSCLTVGTATPAKHPRESPGRYPGRVWNATLALNPLLCLSAVLMESEKGLDLASSICDTLDIELI